MYDHWNAQESFTMLRFLRISPPTHRDGWDWEGLRRAALVTSLQVLRSRPDAEDAAQEALLRAWRARRCCDDAGRPDPWVGRIARNEALRLAARISKRRALEAELLGDNAFGPIEVTEQDDSKLADALSQLAPRDAELVKLRYVEDLQYSAIADRLRMPLGTVKIRLHRLHTRLRSVTSDEGIPRDF
jgi:RNA polymerase sigma-70 factor, ECF subfamily